MVVFNVYEPPQPMGDRIDRAERLVFIKDGFHWWAALVPALWLLVKGLWLELVVFVGGMSLLVWALEAMGATSTVSGTFALIVQIIIGFEAGAIHAAALERRGWRAVGTVTGRNEADCERRFFEAWLPSQPEGNPVAGDAARPASPLMSWTEAALKSARGAIARGRRLVGTKA